MPFIQSIEVGKQIPNFFDKDDHTGAKYREQRTSVTMSNDRSMTTLSNKWEVLS